MSYLKDLISKILYRLYNIRNRKARLLILRLATKLEGGQLCSQTLRRIFKDYHKIEVGLYSYGGCFDPYRIDSFTKIGRYCSFADNVRILGQNHLTTSKSTHPYFFNPIFGYVEKQLNRVNKLIIGNDVWFGSNVTIVPSVSKIGDGAVIGAGAVVTKNIPDFAIVVGNPASVIKYRFSEKTITKLKKQQWWNKSIEGLRVDFPEFLGRFEDTLTQSKAKDKCPNSG